VSDFVDPSDPAAVEAVLRDALATIGADAVAAQLAAVPDLQVTRGRPSGLFRAATPAEVAYGDRRLALDDRGATLAHVVGGIVLATDPVSRVALPGTLAALVVRAVAASGAHDEVSVLLTALRDAVAASR
jgi:hypothetical protein